MADKLLAARDAGQVG
jgi:hypothetical protein